MTERLTIKRNNGDCVLKGKSCVYGWYSFSADSESFRKESSKLLEKAFYKLAEYETAEEDGRMVVLPCKVGSTVYLICHRYTKCSKYGETPDEYSCSGCEEWECDSHKEYYIHVNQSVSLEWIVRNMQLKTFGKTVFISREEAKERLKEVQNGQAD